MRSRRWCAEYGNNHPITGSFLTLVECPQNTRDLFEYGQFGIEVGRVLAAVFHVPPPFLPGGLRQFSKLLLELSRQRLLALLRAGQVAEQVVAGIVLELLDGHAVAVPQHPI